MNTTHNSIKKAIDLSVPVSRVWQALTDHSQFGEWFRVNLDGPFVAGRPSTGHMAYPGYEHLKWQAQVRQIEPESLFSFSWHPYAIDPEVDYSGEPPTLVEFRLERSESGGCRLTVTESGFEGVPEQRRAEAFRKNYEGWGIQMENIAHYVGAA